MDLDTLMTMLKERQGDQASEDFAHALGIRSTSLWAYYRRSKDLGLDNARKMIKYFKQRGDQEMINAIVACLLGDDAISQ